MDPSPWGIMVLGQTSSDLSREFHFLFVSLNRGPSTTCRNYPCCTANHPQAYPKFWAHAFMTDPADDGLLHVFLGPYTYSGIVGASNQVDGLSFLFLTAAHPNSLTIPPIQLSLIPFTRSITRSSTKLRRANHWFSRSVYQIGLRKKV